MNYKTYQYDKNRSPEYESTDTLENSVLVRYSAPVEPESTKNPTWSWFDESSTDTYLKRIT